MDQKRRQSYLRRTSLHLKDSPPSDERLVDLTTEVNRGRDVRRVYYPVGDGIHHGTRGGHPGTPGTVARREFRSPDLNFTVYAAMTIVSQMEGSGRPERHRRRSDLLRTCHRHQVGTARPKARSDRRKSSGGSADGRVQSSVSELLQSAASAVREKFSCEQNFS